MNRLALGFFIAALVCFGVFQSLPIERHEHGWAVWKEVYPVLKAGHGLRFDEDFALFIGLLLGWSLQFLTGPILIPFVCWNKLICRVMAFVSFGALVGIWWLTKDMHFDNVILWSIASQALHLLGCLCIRRPQPEEFVPVPHPEA